MSPPDKDANVAEDHTADPRPASGKPLPPGPPDANDIDFKPTRNHQHPGFRSTPGAGPNPAAAPDSNDSI